MLFPEDSRSEERSGGGADWTLNFKWICLTKQQICLAKQHRFVWKSNTDLSGKGTQICQENQHGFMWKCSMGPNHIELFYSTSEQLIFFVIAKLKVNREEKGFLETSDSHLSLSNIYTTSRMIHSPSWNSPVMKLNFERSWALDSKVLYISANMLASPFYPLMNYSHLWHFVNILFSSKSVICIQMYPTYDQMTEKVHPQIL